jgi:hypothetical protein
MLRKGNAIPLDYILSNGQTASPKLRKQRKRKNLLKNAVFVRIMEIRDQKRKPKLGDLLAFFKKGGQNKEQILKKLERLYSN